MKTDAADSKPRSLRERIKRFCANRYARAKAFVYIIGTAPHRSLSSLPLIDVAMLGLSVMFLQLTISSAIEVLLPQFKVAHVFIFAIASFGLAIFALWHIPRTAATDILDEMARPAASKIPRAASSKDLHGRAERPPASIQIRPKTPRPDDSNDAPDPTPYRWVGGKLLAIDASAPRNTSSEDDE